MHPASTSSTYQNRRTEVWPELIGGVALVGATLITQTLFVGPESRHVRRVRAYLELKTGLKDKQSQADLDDLIARSLAAEVRARTPGRWLQSRWLRVTTWTLASLTFIALVYASRRLDEPWSIIPTIAATLAALVAARNAIRSGREARDDVEYMREATLAESYANYVEEKGRVANFGSVDDRYDLIVENDRGDILEVVESKGSSEPNPQSLLRTRLWARNLEPSARFVVLLNKRLTNDQQHELTRLGISVAYLNDDGSFDVIH